MILLLIGVFTFFSGADCQITKWSAGGQELITGATGKGNCGSVAESGTLSITITTTATTGTITYAVTAQPAGTKGTYKFAIDSSTGVLTLAAGKLDYETDKYLVVAITGTDGVSTPHTGTLTCNITITDVNDVAPVFAKPNTCITVKDALGSGEDVATRTATDGDASKPNNVIGAYTITEATGKHSDFKISSAGVIATKKVLDAATISRYILNITAADTGAAPKALTGTATLTVCVGADCCSGAAVIGISWMALMVVLFLLLK